MSREAKIILSFAVLPLLAACTSVSSPKPVASLRSSVPFEETVARLQVQTQKCWATDVNPVKDGILLSSRASKDAAAIVAWRVNWGVGISKEPFIALQVTRANDAAVVEISEGEFSSSFMGKVTLEAAADVPRWLQGDLECKPFAHSLWHYLP